MQDALIHAKALSTGVTHYAATAVAAPSPTMTDVAATMVANPMNWSMTVSERQALHLPVLDAVSRRYRERMAACMTENPIAPAQLGVATQTMMPPLEEIVTDIVDTDAAEDTQAKGEEPVPMSVEL